MKTRSDLYSREAAELLRVVSEYKALLTEQLYRLFPGKAPVIKTLLANLHKQGRIFYNPQMDRYSANEDCDSHADMGMIAAFWVLLDFIDKVEYHFASDFPVKISFFTDGEMYDIIHVPSGQEMLIGRAIAGVSDNSSRRIVLIDSQEQIPQINIANTVGFCTADAGGSIHYYKLE